MSCILNGETPRARETPQAFAQAGTSFLFVAEDFIGGDILGFPQHYIFTSHVHPSEKLEGSGQLPIAFLVLQEFTIPLH